MKHLCLAFVVTLTSWMQAAEPPAVPRILFDTDIAPDCAFTWRPDPAKQQAYLLKRRIDGQPNDRSIETTLDELLGRPPVGERQERAPE